MSVIAVLSIPATEFPLGELLEVRPGVQIRLESMIPTADAVVPYFWVEAPDIEAVEAALADSPLVEAAYLVDRIGDEALFRVTWSEDIDGVFDTIAETDGVVLTGTGHGDDWSFQLRFADSDELESFYQRAREKGIPITIEAIHDPVEHAGLPETLLTRDQAEAISVALEAGYFDVPRRITLDELGERLEISDSAVSQRIRRGLTKLLDVALTTE